MSIEEDVKTLKNENTELRARIKLLEDVLIKEKEILGQLRSH